MRVLNIVLALLVLSVASYATSVVIFLNYGGLDTQTYDIKEFQTESIEEIKEVKIDGRSADVIIKSTDKEDMTITLIGKVNTNLENIFPILTVDKSNDKLHITLDREPDNDFIVIYEVDYKIEVEVPKSYNENFEVVAHSGDVDIKDVNLNSVNSRVYSGDLQLSSSIINEFTGETHSGEINIDSIYSNKIDFISHSTDTKISNSEVNKLSYESHSGDLEFDEFKVNNVKISSSSGDITSEKSIIDKMSIESYSGNIDLNYINEFKELDIDSKSGDITLDLPDTAKFNVDFETMSGSWKSEIPISITEQQSERSIKGSVGRSNNLLKIKTYSGNIMIE